jgi:hypothetical protein
MHRICYSSIVVCCIGNKLGKPRYGIIRIVDVCTSAYCKTGESTKLIELVGVGASVAIKILCIEPHVLQNNWSAAICAVVVTASKDKLKFKITASTTTIEIKSGCKKPVLVGRHPSTCCRRVIKR